MNNEQIVITDALKVKLEKAKIRLIELDDIVKKAEEKMKTASIEKDKIAYMLSYLEETDLSNIAATNSNLINIKPAVPLLNKKALYSQIAKENMGKIMSGVEILQKISEKGITIQKATHHANLSNYSKDPTMPIRRVSVGQYEFQEQSSSLL